MKVLTKAEADTYMALRTGIGASDVPVILEISPFQSAYQLWLQKTGRAEAAPPSEAMEAGTANEPAARTWMGEQLGNSFPPLTAAHDEYEFIIASADGWNETLGIGIEVKCPRSSKTYDYCIANDAPPPHYYLQLCQQCAVFDPKEWHFGVWHADGRMWRKSIDVMLARAFWRDEIAPHLIEFQRRVTEDEWPALNGTVESDQLGLISEAVGIEQDREDVAAMEEAIDERMAKIKLGCRAKLTKAGPYRAEWRRYPEAHRVVVMCADADSEVKVRLALKPLEQEREVKSIKSETWRETLRFYLRRSGGTD